MPDALRALVFWSDAWHRTSEWYTMDARALKTLRPCARSSRWRSRSPASAALLLLARSVENSADFNRRQPWILAANACAVLALGVLLARKLWQLCRDFRDHVPGSRLTVRTVGMFGTLVVVPLLVVYLFSLEFLNRGIDSWFRVEIKQGLQRRAGAVALGARPAPARAGAAHRGRSRARSRSLDRPGAGWCGSTPSAARRRSATIVVYDSGGRVLGAQQRRQLRRAAGSGRRARCCCRSRARPQLRQPASRSRQRPRYAIIDRGADRRAPSARRRAASC